MGEWGQKTIAGSGPEQVDYVFPDSLGNGTYTIAMRVRDEEPDGEGAIALACSPATRPCLFDCQQRQTYAKDPQ